MYRPTESAQMTTPLRLQVPVLTSAYGVKAKTYEAAEGIVAANMKTYGGTETTSNGTLVIEDTAQIVCWYRPDITSGCRLERLTDGAVYEVIGEPENIEMRNQFLKLRVRRVKGGV